MTEYIPKGINLTGLQAGKLAKGGTIQLKHEHLHGPHKVHLTKTQIKRIEKAHRDGHGMRLKMSESQLRHNKQKGAGFMDTLKKIGKIAVNSDIGKSLINKGQNAIHGLIDKGANYIGDKTGLDMSGLAHVAKNIVNQTLQKATEHIAGSGLKGGGTVANVLGSIPIIGSFLGPIASMFGGKISNAKAKQIANDAVRAHLKDKKSIKSHLEKRVLAHLKKQKGGSMVL